MPAYSNSSSYAPGQSKLTRRTSSVIHSAPPKQSPINWRDKRPSIANPLPRQSPKSLFEYLLLAVALLAAGYYAWNLLSSSSPKAVLPPPSCNPYDSLGILKVDFSQSDTVLWEPFDPTCPAPHFFGKLLSKSYDSLRFMENKTILLIGDNLDREHVEQFCSMMGHTAEVVRHTHKYATHTALDAHRETNKKGRLSPSEMAQKGAFESTLPRVCRIPALNFMLASVYHFGLDEDDFWKDAPEFSGETKIEQRITSQIKPFIHKINEDGRRSAPDMIELNTGLYDLARFAKRDIDLGVDTHTGLSEERLTWFRHRLERMIRAVSKAFPRVKHMQWRTMHYPESQSAEKDYFQNHHHHHHGPDSGDIEKPYFSLNRVFQVDSVARHLIQTSFHNFSINNFGRLILGHHAHAEDKIHGEATVATTVWADVLLYELWKSTEQEVKP